MKFYGHNKKETAILRNKVVKEEQSESVSGLIIRADLILSGVKFQVGLLNWLALNLQLDIGDSIEKVTMCYLPCDVQTSEERKPIGVVSLTPKYVALLRDLGYVQDSCEIAGRGDTMLLDEMVAEVESFAGKKLKVYTEITTTVEKVVRFGSFY